MIGDHIRTLKAGRWTHAIDCGDETVIVLGDDTAQPPRVRRSYRPEFVAGAEAVEVVLHRERTFRAEEVVARAYSRIAEPALASMFRDSEAFAEWCTTGRLPATRPDVAIAVPEVPARAAPPAPAPSAKAARPAPMPIPKSAAKAKPARAAKPARKPKPARVAKRSPQPKPARNAARKPAKRTPRPKASKRRRG